jgi:flavin-dependent thymidylate synthase
MEILLAGMNVDMDTLAEFQSLAARAEAALGEDPAGVDPPAKIREALQDFLARRNLTPETLSAAYARISRDPRPVHELRQVARRELDRARKSNEAIIFGLGHASVAEHAVFNLDILGISRLAAEFVEHFRLCSYTEKSQRYITLEGDFVTPEEIRATPLEYEFRSVVEAQTKAYFRLYERLQEYFLQGHPEMAAQADSRRTLDGWAKEDARYALSLAVQTQLGMTANARNLERIIQQAAAHPLAEIREVGRRLFRAVGDVAPSIIRYTEPEAYHRDTVPRLYQTLHRWMGESDPPAPARVDEDSNDHLCRLAGAGTLREEVILSGLLHEVLGQSFDRCKEEAGRLGEDQIEELVEILAVHLESYHSLPRAFELASATFECVASASCFAQLKRHRMGTQLVQAYDPSLGITIPPSVQAVGLAEELREVAGRSETVSRRIEEAAPAAAAYLLTNAHRRRVLLQINFRELVHFARLRLDAHAQWDIRDLAARMVAPVRERMPHFGRFLCGKDHWPERRREILQQF